jgi:hypothetical protein
MLHCILLSDLMVAMLNFFSNEQGQELDINLITC